MKNNANIQVSYCVIHAKVREGKKFKAHYLELIYIKYKKNHICNEYVCIMSIHLYYPVHICRTKHE